MSPASGTHASVPCDLGQGTPLSVLQFLHLKSGVSLALITTREIRAWQVGHVQETFLTYCQIDKKQALTGSGAFATESPETEKERGSSGSTVL